MFSPASRLGVNCATRIASKRARNSSGFTTFCIESGSPSPAITAESEYVCAATDATRVVTNSGSAQNSTVSVSRVSSSDTPPVASEARADSITASSSFPSDSCVSMLNVRMVSMSSSKKSKR